MSAATEVQLTAAVSIPVYVTCDGDDLPETLATMITALRGLPDRYATTDGTAVQVKFGDDIAHITLDDLPVKHGDDGENGIRHFNGLGALEEFAAELAFDEWQAQAEAVIEPALKRLRGAMPGESVARALRALADRYELA